MATAPPTSAPGPDATNWGPLITRERIASPQLEALLRGIARCISTQYEQDAHTDLSPKALAAFYKAVGGDYDQLFLQMGLQSIAFIYKGLGCRHSLQPIPSPTYEDPAVPCLKPRGFVVWQTIQLLLGPSEHVPFIQNALEVFDVRDPLTGAPIPKNIPASAWPTQPDPIMLKWHADFSEQLRKESEQTRSSLGERPSSGLSRHSSEGTVATVEEAQEAAGFFANPLFKGKDGRPGVVRSVTQAGGKVFQGGKTVALNVFQTGKMIVDPRTLFSNPPKKKSGSRSASRDRGSDRPTPHRTGSYDQPRRSNRRDTPSPTSSEEAEERRDRETRRRLRRHNSHDSPPSSPSAGRRPRRASSADYKQSERRNRHSDSRRDASPPLARKAAEHRQAAHGQQQPDYFQRRPSQQSSRRTSQQANPGPARNRAASDIDSRHPSRTNSYDRTKSDPSDRSDRPRGTLSGHPLRENVSPLASHNLTPIIQEEWDTFRQDALRRGTITDQDSTHTDSSRDGQRTENAKPAVGGVGGRRYPSDAPWTSPRT